MPPPGPDEDRAARLARALRENLFRRKAQARARAGMTTAGGAAAVPWSGGEGGTQARDAAADGAGDGAEGDRSDDGGGGASSGGDGGGGGGGEGGD